MAKTIAELQREITSTVGTITARIDELREEVGEQQSAREKLAEAVHELRRDVDLLKQRLEDHLKRVETWDSRRWALIVLLAGALLSLASGLVLLLLRR